MDNSKYTWMYGDSKKDRKGRIIYFIGYSDVRDMKGNQIELWEPEIKFLERDNK
tara:strand:+ start:184 stop:345 length:162 start_codon:yes stop_codon:yes gene_type:complete